jgi:fluoride exporter
VLLIIIIGLFAVVGALLRDGIGELTSHWWHGVFPVATLFVNLAGCFILGWFTTHIKKLEKVHTYIKTGFSTGLVGSFTTFSTFSVESIQLFESGHTTLALLYLLDSYLGGWAFVFLGYKFGKYIMASKGVGYR